MPANVNKQTQYIGAATLQALNSAALYEAGSIGQRLTDAAGRVYQTVVSDSGPTTIAAGDVAFWKTRSTYAVTNKLADAPQGRNGVAGMFVAAVTPGNYCRIQIGGTGVNTIKTAGAPNQGMIVVANSGTASDTVGIPAGTAPTYVPLGVYTGEPVASQCAIELSIGSMAQNP